MDTIKVLNLVYTLNAGGVETLEVNLFRNMDRNRFKVDFLVIRPKGVEQFYDNEVKKLGANIIEVGDFDDNHIKKFFRYEAGIYKAIRDGKYDVVHINSGHIHTFPELLFTKLLKVNNVITHSHSEGLKRSTKFYRLRIITQRIYRHITPYMANHLLTCSDLASKWAYSKKSIESGKVIQINNGVVPEQYVFSDEDRKTLRQSLGIREELLIGHIGRFDIRKNHSFILETLVEIKKHIADAKVIFCGTGQTEDDIRRYVDKLKLSDSVIFYGVTKEIPKVLSAIDIFMFPSISEGLPVVGVEAQAAGVPVFASDVITKDIEVTPVWHTLSLQDGAEKWAKEIIDEFEKHLPHMDTVELIKRSGFDIRDTACKIEKIYSES